MPRETAPAGLTTRQQEALEALREFQMEWGYPPTRSELGDMLGVSAQTADFHLRALERKGFVEISGHARGVTFVSGPRETVAREVPIVGRVAAGRPVLAVENLEGRLPLPEGSGADFALRVEGDSMIEAGIFDGDLVLVQQTDEARKGEIVVALLGEGETVEATVKRYLPGRGRVVLRPANATLQDIVVRPEDGFALVGRVVGVLRLWD